LDTLENQDPPNIIPKTLTINSIKNNEGIYSVNQSNRTHLKVGFYPFEDKVTFYEE